jgi:nucleotide-binding universal stress UspA family protein
MERIVVGVDGSEHSKAALRWAAAEAAMRGAPLTALLVADLTHPRVADEDRAREVLAAIVQETLPDDRCVALEVACGKPSAVLAERTGADRLVVVGSRGLGGFGALFLGSVAQRVTRKAAGPVAVIRPGGPNGAAVVVGVDGTATALQALGWAATEARARHAPMTVLQAWQVPAVATSPWIATPDLELTADLRALAKDELHAAVTDATLAGIEVEEVLAHGNAAHALVGRHEAGLLVIGSNGSGLVSGAFLGSVAQQVLHHAQVPVVLVPAT